MLGKLTVPEMAKKLLTLYGTRRFITVFTGAHHFTDRELE
jgi:hypothetical protein